MSHDSEQSDVPAEVRLRRWEFRCFVAESFLLIAALSALAGMFLLHRGPISKAAFFAALILLVPLVLFPVQSVVSRVRNHSAPNAVWMTAFAIAAASGAALSVILRG